MTYIAAAGALMQRPAEITERTLVASELAKTLVGMRRRAQLSRRQLEEVSGVSEETIKGIETRQNWRPSPDTLRKIATGLATNRALGRVDPPAVEEMHGTLMHAADYLPKETPPPAAPAPYSEAAMRDALLARGFRAYETPQVDRLLTILAGCNADERDDLLRSLETILSARQRRDESV